MTPYEKILAEVRYRANHYDPAKTYYLDFHRWLEENRAELNPPTSNLFPDDVVAEIERIKKEFGYVNKVVLGEWVVKHMKVEEDMPKEEPKLATIDPEKRKLIRAAVRVIDAWFPSSVSPINQSLEELSELISRYSDKSTPEHSVVFGIETVGDLIESLQALNCPGVRVRKAISASVPNPQFDPDSNDRPGEPVVWL